MKMAAKVLALVAVGTVIAVSTIGFSEAQEKLIPGWVKDYAGWWADDQITDRDFLGGIQFLITEDIIQIPEMYELENSNSRLRETVRELRSEISELKAEPSCVLFCDSDGYEPKWAKSEGYLTELEAVITCSNLDKDGRPLIDAEWCLEFLKSGIVDAVTRTVSKLTGSGSINKAEPSCVLFCDSDGYEPKWAKSMGEMQAIMNCWDVGSLDSDDLGWCLEFSGYMMDDTESQFRAEDFDIDIVSCKEWKIGGFETGQFIVKFGITDNGSAESFIEAQVMLLDKNKDVIDVTSTYVSTKPGLTVYSEVYLDNDPEIHTCKVQIIGDL